MIFSFNAGIFKSLHTGFSSLKFRNWQRSNEIFIRGWFSCDFGSFFNEDSEMIFCVFFNCRLLIGIEQWQRIIWQLNWKGLELVLCVFGWGPWIWDNLRLCFQLWWLATDLYDHWSFLILFMFASMGVIVQQIHLEILSDGGSRNRKLLSSEDCFLIIKDVVQLASVACLAFS